MNILLISECSKNALKETRRILDQFAERRGERAWQTPITKQGLDTLRRMLRKNARKNSAIACHWIRGKNHSELLWIVDDASRFNERGAVPTNTTRRDILRKGDENDWHTGECIRLLAALAALFHDFGKAIVRFQNKLLKREATTDAFRHEWISLRLLEAFVGEDGDQGWLKRLASLPENSDLGWLENLLKDGVHTGHPSPFKSLPPVAKLIGWLIASHHRLPVNYGANDPQNVALASLPEGIYETWLGSNIKADGLNDKEFEKLQKDIKDCWKFEHAVPFTSSAWKARARKLAQKALKRKSFFNDMSPVENTYVIHMSRLILMLADHHYSSLTDPKQRVNGETDYPLFANTRRDTGELNQRLDEHLIGVEKITGKIVHDLSRLDLRLPRVARHKGFKGRSRDRRFRWQDKAYDLAVTLRERSLEQGFFGVNMASTGCGKTLANGRIMYALADPAQGARFSIALGLRMLTLQTGEVYRREFGLGADGLAIMVGGLATRELHEHNHNMKQKYVGQPFDVNGAESSEDLLPDNSYVHYEGSLDDGPLSAWLASTRGASQLVSAPILTCTIDHLIPATESLRGGRQMAPMLRLMTADLILDEPDDFDVEDLPALARLVHWAGLLGSRVLLSSATLPPAIVQGLFEAYAAGRKVYVQNRGTPGLPFSVCTAWFDEFSAQSGAHESAESFIKQHRTWVEKRSKALVKAGETRRKARILPLSVETGKDNEHLYELFANEFSLQAYSLHRRHHNCDPKSGKRISFGLVRMANINPLVGATKAFTAMDTRDGHRLHFCCYHSQHPLLVRASIEGSLDHILDRRVPDRIFDDKNIRAILDGHQEQDHLIIVLATAVAEVGRDHDYDWAIVEPSSMRSIIQLAGRVRRHRIGPCESPNIYLLDTNLKHMKNGSATPAFTKPGFEDKYFPLDSHRLSEILTEEQLSSIDSRPRIMERAEAVPRMNLVDLEHDHLRSVMLGDSSGQQRKPPVNWWWTTKAHLSGELQRIQRFRHDPMGRQDYVFLYDEDSEQAVFTRIERDGNQTPVSNLLHEQEPKLGRGVSVWGEADYLAQLQRLAEELGMPMDECSRRFGVVELPERGVEQGWDYHPALGLSRRE
ncbi:MAG: type I-F CRISPR-associated helicase Cas3f [Candidatus Nitrospinota bacterium M3_3B_026]